MPELFGQLDDRRCRCWQVGHHADCLGVLKAAFPGASLIFDNLEGFLSNAAQFVSFTPFFYISYPQLMTFISRSCKHASRLCFFMRISSLL